MSPEVLGLIAGAFTTFASLPQIAYVLRTRSMDDVSLLTLCMFGTGVSLWLAYGIALRAPSVVIWNALSLALYGVQIGLKLAVSERGSNLMRRLRRSIAHVSG